MAQEFLDIDPRDLRVPSRRGADPSKLQRQVARIAKLAPGLTIRVEVVGKLRRAYAGEPRIGDFLP
jgi:hypothetical protein